MEARLYEGTKHSRATDLLRHGVLASEREPTDPMERAIHALGAAHLDAAQRGATLVHEYGLSPAWPVMSHVWRADGAIANHPANLAVTYAALAQLRGITPAALATQVTANFTRLFGPVA